MYSSVSAPDVYKRQVCTRAKLPSAEELCTRLKAQFAEITTILLNVNAKNTNVILGTETHTLYGPGYIEDTLCGVPVQLGPLSFYQVNTLAAEQLYGIAAQYAQLDRKSTRLNSSHEIPSRMPSSA